MSNYFVITGKHTGHRWLACMSTWGVRTGITVRHDWSNNPGFGGISYYPRDGKSFVSRFIWWAMARARMHVWLADRRDHREHRRAEKVRRIALRGERP